MRMRLASALATAILLGGIGSAVADEIIVTPEQETVVREYVKKKPIASISLLGLDLSLGAAVPETVELHTFEDPSLKYRYTVIDNQTVLVDPSTRKIIRVIK